IISSIAVQTHGSGISNLLAVGTTFTGSGSLYCQWELSPSSGNTLCILFSTMLASRQHLSSCYMVGEHVIEGPEMIEVTNEKVVVAKEKLKEACTRQKSYADKHHRSIEFQPGDRVFLKVSPARGVRRFGIKGKLSPRFIGPFEILDRVGEVSYRLTLPPQLSHVHNVFHVSLLRGYKYHPLHVVSYPFDQIRADLSYVEEPEAILDRQDRVMRNKTIPFVKILRSVPIYLTLKNRRLFWIVKIES
nr:putative reverse transcriptase domain-containing protein [Tanacetum cinerariifolium]